MKLQTLAERTVDYLHMFKVHTGEKMISQKQGWETQVITDILGKLEFVNRIKQKPLETSSEVKLKSECEKNVLTKLRTLW